MFTVPDLDEAARFYTAFSLDVRRVGTHLALHSFDHPHCWAEVHVGRDRKQLQYLRRRSRLVPLPEDWNEQRVLLGFG